MTNLILASIILLISQHASALVPDKILSANIPATLTKDPETGATRTINDGVVADQLSVKLDGPTKLPYDVVLLKTTTLDCSLLVFKEGPKGSFKKYPVTFSTSSSIHSCLSLETKDFNQDGKPEIVVQILDGKEVGSPSIFRWDGAKLIDSTPTQTLNGVTTKKLRSVLITDKPVQGKLMIFDYSNDGSPTKVFTLTDKGLQETGSYDSINMVGKTVSGLSLRPSVKDGNYTLTMTNVSSHQRAVRAEISINGKVLVFPKQFCKSPAPAKPDAGKDDLDDKNEDKMKRCLPNNTVTSSLNLKREDELKIKVYGRGDSLMRFTLTKK
ncbi:hypothetical protein [Bdellovibrio bacteriovorus]|uniref:VCBS repeat-containing protein n=1 Tax=Bdellovibrio bacteriovorus str. Tiberius TaxID=1069642 RepID=K7YZR9_BDEBC|nr:hypothetical protein [Bdellovibrio bacteriovorus]AFY02230.1 Hypothetical protein Bdt_2547 [Bdellovibrio bacteriovorus str. Tiberius]